MAVLELTLEEYNSIMQAREFININEFCNKVNYVVDALMEDVKMTVYLEDGEDNQQNNNTDASTGDTNTTPSSEENKDNNAENKDENKDKDKSDDKKKEKSKKKGNIIIEKIKKVIGAIVKFVKKIIPTITSKIKEIFSKHKHKKSKKDVKIEFIKTDGIKQVHDNIDKLDGVFKTPEKAEEHINTIKEVNGNLDKVKQAVANRDQIYVAKYRFKTGENLENNKKILADIIKLSKAEASYYEGKGNLFKTLNVENMSDECKNVFNMIIGSYASALEVCKENIKMISNSIKSINQAIGATGDENAVDNNTDNTNNVNNNETPAEANV